MLKTLKNESKEDRIIRVIFALILSFVTFVFLNGILQAVLYIVSFVLLLTGLTGFCPLYKVLNFSTLKK